MALASSVDYGEEAQGSVPGKLGPVEACPSEACMTYAGTVTAILASLQRGG